MIHECSYKRPSGGLSHNYVVPSLQADIWISLTRTYIVKLKGKDLNERELAWPDRFTKQKQDILNLRFQILTFRVLNHLELARLIPRS